MFYTKAQHLVIKKYLLPKVDYLVTLIKIQRKINPRKNNFGNDRQQEVAQQPDKNV